MSTLALRGLEGVTRGIPRQPARTARQTSAGRPVLLITGLLLAAATAARADDLRARIDAAGDAAKWNADVVTVLEHTDVTIMPNGLGVARTHNVVKVLRDGGIRSQAVQRFPFDPHTNRLELEAVKVWRQDGTVEDVPISQPAQQPQPAHGIFWPTDQYLVELPRLEIGDAVETQRVLTGFNVAYLAEHAAGGEAGANAAGTSAAAAAALAMPAGFNDRNALGVPLQPPVPGHWHDEVHFWAGSPVIEKRYTVRTPKDKPLQFEIYNGELRTALTFEDEHLVYTFEKKNISPFSDEPAMEATPNVGTKLLLATLPTWEDKSRWLYQVSEPQFEADDDIRAAVAEIIKDCRTDEEKFTALNHWVAENIRYAGTSRGMCEGYTIHKSVETFRDRCGVCKDKAGMLVTMLRVAGFDSFLVMTMARQRVDPIPADQFNHAVTCVRQKDGSLVLLDPTWMPKSRDNWSKLEPLQHVVFGLPEGKGLSQTPDFPPEDNEAVWRGQATIAADGRLSGAFTLVTCGAPENRLRRALATYAPAERGRVFDETVQRLSANADLTVRTCTDPVDFSGPATVEAEYAAAGYALGNGEQRFLALPLMQGLLADRILVDILGKTGPKERKYALRLWATRLARFEETISVPDGWKVVRKPEPVKLDGPAAALNFQIDTAPGQIRYTCELRVKTWQVPPDGYANFKEVMDKFEELAGRVITCELEGPHVQR